MELFCLTPVRFAHLSKTIYKSINTEIFPSHFADGSFSGELLTASINLNALFKVAFIVRRHMLRCLRGLLTQITKN